jgi:hypothetical protein
VTYLRYAGRHSPTSGDVTSFAAATITGQSTLHPSPPPWWRGSTSHCDVTCDTAVDSDNRQQHKKPAEQSVISQLRVSVNHEVNDCSCSEWIGNVKNTNCVISSDRVWIKKSPSPVKSSSYKLSCIECMAVTPAREVFVKLQMAVAAKLWMV